MAQYNKPSPPPIKVTDEPVGVVVPAQVDPEIAKAADRTIRAPEEEGEAVTFGPHSGKYLIKYLPEKDSPKDEDIRKVVKYLEEQSFQITTRDKRLIKALKAAGHTVLKEEK